MAELEYEAIFLVDFSAIGDNKAFIESTKGKQQGYKSEHTGGNELPFESCL